MKITHKQITRFTLIAIVAFTVVSAFGCFAIMEEYITDYDLFKAGDVFLKERKPNCIVLMLILSAGQIGMLASSKGAARIGSIVLAAMAFLITVFYVPACNATSQILGGIIHSYFVVTWLGYIAMVLAAVIVVLQICMHVNKQK